MTKLDQAFGVSKGLRRVQLHLCRHGDLQINAQGLKLVLGDVIFSIIAGVILQGGPLLVINGVIYTLFKTELYTVYLFHGLING